MSAAAVATALRSAGGAASTLREASPREAAAGPRVGGGGAGGRSPRGAAAVSRARDGVCLSPRQPGPPARGRSPPPSPTAARAGRGGAVVRGERRGGLRRLSRDPGTCFSSQSRYPRSQQRGGRGLSLPSGLGGKGKAPLGIPVPPASPGLEVMAVPLPEVLERAPGSVLGCFQPLCLPRVSTRGLGSRR